MPRSRGNGNFIDKTFSIVANILLQIIPTTSGEKEAFTYYRDGAIWFFLTLSLPRNAHDSGSWEIEQFWKNSTLLEGKVWK